MLLVAAALLHLGFQLTVSALVYPALAAVASGEDSAAEMSAGEVSAGEWSAAHTAHSRRIVPLVGLTYALLFAALVRALVVGPFTGWLVVAGAGALLTVLTTAFAAAPTHGRLGAGRDQELLERLRRVDLVRLAGAVACALGSVGWALAA